MKGVLCISGFPHLTNSGGRLIGFLVATLGSLLLTAVARAVPYASGVSNNAGTVSFILNESADNVTVMFDGGASSIDLGALGSGAHSFNLDAATSFEIVVRKVVPPAWTQISSDTNILNRFSFPRGVAVNPNPGTPAFGRIYVSNSRALNTSVANSNRPCGDGIYVLNADGTDALGRGDTANTGGLTFDAGNTFDNPETPFRIEVGQDNYLYIGGFGTNIGTLYRVDADANNGEVVLAGIGLANGGTVHGLIGGSPIARGSLAEANLQVWSTDGNLSGNLNRLMRWDIGAGPLPSSVTPVPVAVPSPLLGANAHITTDNDTAPDGKFIVMQNRFNGTEVGVAVLASSGTSVLWNSLTVSRAISNNASATDILRQARAVKVSSDNRKLAAVRDDGQTWILPMTNGIPDLNRRELVPTHAAVITGRDLCWDAAGNLYVASSGTELLRVWSPGGDTRATTRSDGTFSFFEVLPPEVSLEVSDNLGSENGSDTISFTISRAGDTTAPLTVNYSLTGTALNGSDYSTNELSITILAGQSSASVILTPADDTEPEPIETVVLTLVPSTNYVILTSGPATAYILDNETPQFTLTTARPVVYEDSFYYMPEFILTRLGETNVEVLVEVITTNSTATEGFDFSFLPPTIDVAPGVVQRPFSVTLIRDDEVEGDETLGLTIIPGFDSYTIGSPHTALTTIRDNDSAECVLFRDDFDTDTSGNWITRFGANNGLADSGVGFSDDYSLRGIPAAPHSAGSTTRGLFVQVNKGESSARGSAGINLYPMQQQFSGDYALRFDLYLSLGGASTTEHALAGVNHSGTLTNRVTQSTDTGNSTAGGDGVYVAIETDGSNNRDWTAYTYPTPTSLPTAITNRTATSLSNLVTSPPYAFPGSPGNNATFAAGGTNFFQWADVELRQESSVITLRVNGGLVYSFPNTSSFTSGNIMLGMNDQFDSIGNVATFAVFDNVRVIDLRPTRITSIQVVGGNQVQIDFTDRCPADPTAYRLQRASSLQANFVDDPASQIMVNLDVPGGFRATAPLLGPIRYYRIRR